MSSQGSGVRVRVNPEPSHWFVEKVKEKEKDLQNNNNECALVHLPVMLEQLLLLTGFLTFKPSAFCLHCL